MLLELISFLKIEKVMAQVDIISDDVRLVNPLGEGATFITVINNIIDFLIVYVSPPLLALMILVGGFQILYARDDAATVKKGKQTIQYAVIGFVVILCAKGVALVLIKILGD